jgi:hypothetical protein
MARRDWPARQGGLAVGGAVAVDGTRAFKRQDRVYWFAMGYVPCAHARQPHDRAVSHGSGYGFPDTSIEALQTLIVVQSSSSAGSGY